MSNGHSELSASGSERWLNCPGSVALSREAPEPEDNQYAINGTIAHELLEASLNGAKIHWSAYDPEMKKAVIDAKNIVENSTDGKLLTEKKVSLSHIHESMFGTLDIAIVSEFETLRVYDFKYGTSIVRVTDSVSRFILNAQLAYYALGMAHEYGYNFTDCEIGIIQPRVKSNIFSRINVDIPRLKGFETIFRIGVDRVYSKNPKLKIGSWCKWCRAISLCPLQKKIRSVKLNNVFDGYND